MLFIRIPIELKQNKKRLLLGSGVKLYRQNTQNEGVLNLSNLTLSLKGLKPEKVLIKHIFLLLVKIT